MNYENGTLHLTIDVQGLISLWDSELEAITALLDDIDGTYVPLQLTDDQLKQLKEAQEKTR